VRIVFLSLQAREPLAYGPLILAAVLRRLGHEVDLVQAASAQAAAAAPAVGAADVLAYSATTGLHRVYAGWVRALRRRFPAKFQVMGGPHPTFFPEVLGSVPLDGVCLGEGEESFPEFLEALRDGRDAVPAGWWARRGGVGPVRRGPARGPVRDLDALPRAAWELFYDRDPRYRAAPAKAFLAGRGCPYRCTYCFNRELNERHRAFGPLLRVRDPEAVCDEILEVRRRWGLRMVWFLDANFVAHGPWLDAFLPLYRRRVGLPFMCKLRAERATERTVRALADAGCTLVGVGIESGSERLRREVLGRPTRDADILDGCRRLGERGVRVLTFNMLGLPGETLDDALRTVALNVACGVTYAAATILQPYPGTELARRAVEQGHFDGDFDRLRYSYFASSPLRFPSARDRDRITNLQRLFGLAVEFPEVRRRLRRLIDRPPQRLFRFLFQARHELAFRRGFYRAWAPQAPRRVGTAALLAQAARDLGLAG
jgi:anaerobic magnesium-protoporphyrin IX monomethyl ester cyclase